MLQRLLPAAMDTYLSECGLFSVARVRARAVRRCVPTNSISLICSRLSETHKDTPLRLQVAFHFPDSPTQFNAHIHRRDLRSFIGFYHAVHSYFVGDCCINFTNERVICGHDASSNWGTLFELFDSLTRKRDAGAQIKRSVFPSLSLSFSLRLTVESQLRRPWRKNYAAISLLSFCR